MVRNFLQKLMYGRYGGDQLNNFLLILYFVFWLLAIVSGVELISSLGLVCIFIAIIRMMSRKIDRRRAENAKFLQLTAPANRWIKLQRTKAKDKEHRYFKCPNCKQTLRVPRGKGKITITCRSCGTSFTEKS